jgi:hypothetical protein
MISEFLGNTPRFGESRDFDASPAPAESFDAALTPAQSCYQWPEFQST